MLAAWIGERLLAGIAVPGMPFRMIRIRSSSDDARRNSPARQIGAADLVALEAVAGDAVGLIEDLALFGLARDVEALREPGCGARDHGDRDPGDPVSGANGGGHVMRMIPESREGGVAGLTEITSLNSYLTSDVTIEATRPERAGAIRGVSEVVSTIGRFRAVFPVLTLSFEDGMIAIDSDSLRPQLRRSRGPCGRTGMVRARPRSGRSCCRSRGATGDG